MPHSLIAASAEGTAVEKMICRIVYRGKVIRSFNADKQTAQLATALAKLLAADIICQ